MPTIRRFRRRRLLVTLVLLAAACGGNDEGFQQIQVIVAGGGGGTGAGSGTVVASDPAVAINCTITNGVQGTTGCNDTFEDAGGGGTFNLVAAPSGGSTFTSWSSACTSVSGTTCTMTFGASDGDLVFNVTATFAPPPAAVCNNPLVIQDQFASDAGWTTSVIVGSGAPTQTVAFQSTGGNPAGYRQMQHIFPAAGSITVYHDYGTTTYDPSTQGAIDHINYYEDQIEINPPFAGAAVGAGFTVTQGTGRYSVILRPPAGAFSNTTWETTSLLDLTAASFSAGLNLATGGPLTFGYFRANTNNGGTLTVTHGIDNWKVQICR